MSDRNVTAGYFVLPRLTDLATRDKMLFGLLVEWANYRDTPECKRGQLITSALTLAKETGWTEKQIRVSIGHLRTHGYITVDTNKNKKSGMKITIENYGDLQDLSTYKTQKMVFNDFQKGEYNGKYEGEYKGEYAANENPCGSKDESSSQKIEGEYKGEYEGEYKGNSLTEVLTTDKQKVKQKKILKDLPEQLRSREDVESFVDSQMRANAMPLPKRLFVEYFNTLRLVRKTATLSANVATRTWDKLHSHFCNQKRSHDDNAAVILYALSAHVMRHDDKDEKYTFGIIRNTSEHEARQKYMRLVNQKQNEPSRGESSGRHEISDRQRRADELDSLSL
ncbi:hypothetical protein [Brevibacillus agri]|uniref:hypothetical protein n=1 Tax=Brevibacillus agri TaxID=51101 RepID=UPI003D1C93A3